jgi:DNA mismatch endonuclease (patch repair protein)
MSRVKSRGNRATELRLIEIFRNHQIKGWRRRAKVFGSPDFVFWRARLVVFVDGCFWHGCPIHGSIPESNRDFWVHKLQRNMARDRAVDKALTARGWRIVRIWQHELRHRGAIAQSITEAIADTSTKLCHPSPEAALAASCQYARPIFPDSNIEALAQSMG